MSTSDSTAPIKGMYDPARRRRAVRKGREQGCWVYVPQAELVKAGWQPGEPPPFYRVWGSRKGGLVARLYRQQ